MFAESLLSRLLTQAETLNERWTRALADGRLTSDEARDLARRTRYLTANTETALNAQKAAAHVQRTGHLPRDYQYGLWMEVPDSRPTDRPAA